MSVIGRMSRVRSGLAMLAGTAVSFRDDEAGAVMAEYATLLVLLTAAMLAAVLTLGSAVSDNVGDAADAIEAARKGANCNEGEKAGNKWC